MTKSDTFMEIDGSHGEGGGQILRTSLGLSALTGKPFRMVNIRAGRAKPGLLRQHLTAVNAAAEICGAEVEGAALGSQELAFRPGPVRPGRYRFAVGTAGSATLVLQAVLPPLLTAAEPSELTLEGGTHNPCAPPFEFLREAFLSIVNRTGPRVEAELERHGFYPAGGGRFTIRITPAERLARLELTERGAVQRVRARALVSKIPVHVAERELNVIESALDIEEMTLEAAVIDTSPGPGNVLTVAVESEHVTEVFTGFGERGVRAEDVARRVAEEVESYLSSDAPVGEHLADQLLIPMAMAGGGRSRTAAITEHTRTNAEIVARFLDVQVTMEPVDGSYEVAVRG